MPVVSFDGHSRLVRETEEHVKQHMKEYKDCSHDWSHVCRVRSMALHLAHSENTLNFNSVNEKLVELAAILHDVGDVKFLAPGDTTEGVLSLLMERIGYPHELQEAIKWILSRVSFRYELEHPERQKEEGYLKELWCVQDADRLDAIGAIGVARCFAYCGARNIALYELEIAPAITLTSEEYNMRTSSNDNARNHFYEKLLKLKGLMKTNAGKAEAARRHEMLRYFIKEFDHECGLDSSILIHYP